MKYSGFDFKIGHLPPLSLDFMPIYAFMREYLKGAKHNVSINLKLEGGYISVFDTFIYGTLEMAEADINYLDIIMSFLLRSRGGLSLSLCCDGVQWINKWFMEEFVIDKRPVKNLRPRHNSIPQKFLFLPYGARVSPNEASIPFGRHLNGCRIGFDAGGSDRKVAAVIDGETVFSEEIEWLPKINPDPNYHYSEVLSSLKSAASKMPRVDAVGVSSAGAVLNNRLIGSSLFQSIPLPYPDNLPDIYIRAAKEVCSLEAVASNDGNVSALAGSMSTGKNKVLGIAMGTSQAGGYIDKNGNINGWRNGLSSAVVDISPFAAVDTDNFRAGVGSQYFSQQAVIRLSLKAGIKLNEADTPAKNLKLVQNLMERDDLKADSVFESIGCFLGHTIALYACFYDISYVPIYGRVASGKGGERIVNVCNKILREEYPDIYTTVKVGLPDEKSRRIGQCVAAASLPVIK